MVSMARVLLLSALAVAAALLAGCGGEESEPSPAQQKVETANFDGVENGELSLELKVSPKGSEPVLMRIIGNFEKDKDPLAQMDFATEAGGRLGGRPVEFFGGFSLLNDVLVINYESQLYGVDPTTFKAVNSGLEAAQGDGSGGDLGACPEAAGEIEADDLVENLSMEPKKAEYEGVPVTWIAGDLDVPAAIDALSELAQDPGCGAQLDAFAPDLVEDLAKSKEELADATSRAQVRIALDAKGVPRDLTLKWLIGPQGGLIEEQTEIDFEMKLLKVNEEEGLPRITGTKPLGALLDKFGLDLQTARDASGEEVLLAVLEVVGQQFTGRAGL